MSVPIILIVLAVVAVAVFLVLRSRKSAEMLPPAEPLPPLQPPTTAPRVEQPAAQPVAQPPGAQTPTATAAPQPAGPVAQPTAPSGDEVEVPIETAAQPVVAAPAQPAVAAPAQPAVAAAPPVAAPPAKRDLTALKKGLQQTRGGWVQRLVGLFGGKKELDPQLLQDIEETLLTGDVGVKTTQRMVEVLKERLGRADVSNPEVVWATLREAAREVLDVKAPPFGSRASGKPLVILVVGVNGVGKTTTIGKLASRYKEQGNKVYLAAADTFRAAAVAQLDAWGRRVGVQVVKGKDLSKPSAVVFDAVQKGAAEGADVVIADTAGRLHTKTPLMDELRKLRDSASKALPGAPHEILLVLDATTGQNGITQVKEFREALDLTGIVLTKLDGTAKGGVILGICDEFKLPVRFVGVGERVDDLREFDPEDFTQALFTSTGDEDAEVA